MGSHGLMKKNQSQISYKLNNLGFSETLSPDSRKTFKFWSHTGLVIQNIMNINQNREKRVSMVATLKIQNNKKVFLQRKDILFLCKYFQIICSVPDFLQHGRHENPLAIHTDIAIILRGFRNLQRP